MTPTVVGVLVFCLVPTAAAQNTTTERRSGWYIGGAVGGSWASDINQRGSNRDTLCYPNYACFDDAPHAEQSGYRWGTTS